jgi:hypothetical protein
MNQENPLSVSLTSFSNRKITQINTQNQISISEGSKGTKGCDKLLSWTLKSSPVWKLIFHWLCITLKAIIQKLQFQGYACTTYFSLCLRGGEHDGTLSLGTTSKASITINYGHYEQLTVHFLFDPFLFKQVAPMSPVKATTLFCGWCDWKYTVICILPISNSFLLLRFARALKK